MYQWPLRRLQPASHTRWNMDRSNKNWQHVPHTHMRYSERTTRMSTTNWKRQREEHHTRPLSSHSRGQKRQGGMVGNHWAVCWEGQVGGGNQVTGATPPHTCVEGTEQFFPGEVHRPTSQCLCLDAGLCRAHPVPAAKWAQLSWISAGRNSNQ